MANVISRLAGRSRHTVHHVLIPSPVFASLSSRSSQPELQEVIAEQETLIDPEFLVPLQPSQRPRLRDTNILPSFKMPEHQVCWPVGYHLIAGARLVWHTLTRILASLLQDSDPWLCAARGVCWFLRLTLEELMDVEGKRRARIDATTQRRIATEET